MRTTDTHVYFYGGPAVFSNWYPAKIWDRHTPFENSEQNFMACKAHFFCDARIERMIINEPDPAKTKELGRQVRDFCPKSWDCVKFGFMVYVNYLKFSQNGELGQKLLQTGDRILVEASPYDKVWGVGLHHTDDKILDESNWLGQNLLGKALMEVRKLIK